MISLWVGDLNTLQNLWQSSNSEVWWPASRAQGLRTDGFVRGRQWMSSGEEALGSWRELMLSFWMELP